MNLQERLEAILTVRREYVNNRLTPAQQSELLHGELGNTLELALYAQGMQDEEVRDQHEALTQLAGACLYLLHPEDPEKPALETVFGTPHPAPASQAVAHAFTGFYGTCSPEAVVYQLGDGTYRRKPRPDRG